MVTKRLHKSIRPPPFRSSVRTQIGYQNLLPVTILVEELEGLVDLSRELLGDDGRPGRDHAQ